ncbi:MAG: hypothetical protein ABW128_04560 [Rhizorhabdus sp.]
MMTMGARALLGLLSGSALCGAAHAERPELGAFIDLQQIAESQLQGVGEDIVTYTEVSGNLAASIRNRRIVLSASYRASYRIPEVGNLSKNFNQDGILRMQANVIDEWLSTDVGAIVTRSRIDPSGSAQQLNSANQKNLAQTYSAFIQPSLAHRIGDVGFAASYRYAYTKNESGQTGVIAGPPVDRFDSSTAQQADLSIGMQQSSLPFDWTVGAQYRHENTTNLAQRFRALKVSGEIKQPIAATVALVASGGYEKTETSERSALIDSTTGLPVLGKGGRFVVDPASPRVLTYDMAGLIGDAGIIWKPSRRSRFEMRAGYRYGGFSVTGLAEMRPSDRTGLTFILTDQVQSFGQGVSGGLAGAPVDLNIDLSADPATGYQNCLFGKTAGSGRCIGGSLGGASAQAYRERAASIIVSRALREWTVSGSLGYTRRTYIDDPSDPFSLDGVVDQSFFGDLSLNGQLSRVSGVSFSFTGSLFKNGQVGASDVKAGTFSTSYYRTFGRSIRARASLAVDASKQDGITADVSGRAQIGMQYEF